MTAFGVRDLRRAIEDLRAVESAKATQSKVKSETPSTTVESDGPESPMYPEKETSPFLQWTSQGRSEMDKCQWHPTAKCDRPVVGRFAVTSGSHALCAYHLKQLSFKPRKVTPEEAARTARIRARLRQVW